jgi:hypothetical protein
VASIMEMLDPSSLFKFCMTSKDIYAICEDERFWAARVKKDYPGSPKIDDSWKKTWKIRYSNNLDVIVAKSMSQVKFYMILYKLDNGDFISTYHRRIFEGGEYIPNFLPVNNRDLMFQMTNDKIGKFIGDALSKISKGEKVEIYFPGEYSKEKGTAKIQITWSKKNKIWELEVTHDEVIVYLNSLFHSRDMYWGKLLDWKINNWREKFSSIVDSSNHMYNYEELEPDEVDSLIEVKKKNAIDELSYVGYETIVAYYELFFNYIFGYNSSRRRLLSIRDIYDEYLKRDNFVVYAHTVRYTAQKDMIETTIYVGIEYNDYDILESSEGNLELMYDLEFEEYEESNEERESQFPMTLEEVKEQMTFDKKDIDMIITSVRRFFCRYAFVCS